MALLAEIQNEVDHRPAYPGGEGAGVVIVGGGALLPSAYVAIRHLRDRGCRLPVEVWHLGPAELPPFFSELSSSLDVEMVDARAAPGAGDFSRLGGWECKIHALVSCHFEHVILQDADNIALRDPTFLLGSRPYEKYGQIFWPDFVYEPNHQYAIRPRAWGELDMQPLTGVELESGQLVIDRRRCWKMLQYVRALNRHSLEVYDRLTWGDKDTFTLGWMLSRRPYYVVPIRPRFIDRSAGSILWQHWNDGTRLFQHQRKWIHGAESNRYALLANEQYTEQSLSYLDEYWNAVRRHEGSSAPMAPHPPTPGPGCTIPSGPTSARQLAEMARGAYARGDLPTAIEYLMHAVNIAPKVASYRVDLAAALTNADRAGEAIGHLVRALPLGENLPEIHNNLGMAMGKVGRVSEAISAFNNAIALRPVYIQAWHNLSEALGKEGDWPAAIEAWRQALRLTPDSVIAWEGLAHAAEESGDLDLALSSLRNLLRLRPGSAAVRSWFLYTAHYDSETSAQELFEAHREWDRLFGRADHAPAVDVRHELAPGRIRVGYLSPDFRDHTVPRFIGAALTNHDRERFEIFCYSDVLKDDDVTRELRGAVEHWRDIVGLPDARARQIIVDDGIDILIDLRGHAAANRLPLFATKPAPIQINMVGYFDTTGLSAMDYRLTDAWQDPPGVGERLHSEELIRMPRGCWCYRADDAPDPRPPPCVEKGHITFGSLNKVIKISRPCAELWNRVLQAVENSRLMLPAPTEKSTEAFRARLKELGLGIDRIDLVSRSRTRRGYLDRFNQIDIGLDTFPFNGITTTCDGLWMGVPTISLAGQTTVSRAGRSIAHAAGLGDLAVDDADAFVEAAVRLSADREKLCSMRLGMRKRLAESALMDHVGFTRALEAQYVHAWNVLRMKSI